MQSPENFGKKGLPHDRLLSIIVVDALVVEQRNWYVIDVGELHGSTVAGVAQLHWRLGKRKKGWVKSFISAFYLNSEHVFDIFFVCFHCVENLVLQKHFEKIIDRERK